MPICQVRNSSINIIILLSIMEFKKWEKLCLLKTERKSVIYNCYLMQFYIKIYSLLNNLIITK